MRKAVLFFALLAFIAAGCGGRTVLPTAAPTGFTVPTLPTVPMTEPSPFPTATLPPTPTNTPETPAVPILEFPTAGTVMDNGRDDGKDLAFWYFDWSDVPGAVEYELVVTHGEGANLVIQEKVPHSSYYYDNFSLNTSAVNDWIWKVRARVDDQWRAWSEPGGFVLEQLNTDPKLVLGDICSLAELPVDRTEPIEPLPVSIPFGLSIHEYLLEKNSFVDRNFFEPVGTTREEVLALHDLDRGEELVESTVYDKQPENFPEERVLRPVPFQGESLVATQYLTYDGTGHRFTGKVTLGESEIFEIPEEPAVLDHLFRALYATSTAWFVEVAHTVTIDYDRIHQPCFLGDVVQNGDSLSARYGYREAFGFQLLDGKPFYFFNQGGNIGFSYDGKASWLGFDEIPKYAEEYGSPTGGRAPEHWENAVAFFARRGDNWYYVEIGKGP